MRVYIVIASCVWWLVLALSSRLELSLLQVSWSAEASFAIFVYFPFCILLGLIVVTLFPMRRIDFHEGRIHKEIRFLFFLCIMAFVVQSLFALPPALSSDPMNARLEWGFKYVHVATEILIRTGVLVCLGAAVNRGRITRADLWILLSAIIYAFLVVSRGLILEFIIYIIFASVLNARTTYQNIRIRPKHLIALALVCGLFVIYGEWRQGMDFSISEYGEMLFDSNTLAWIFGYFLVNFDNLALLIMEGFHNSAISNIFGPLFQTLQIMNFDEVDDYLYVGKFNLGTALRPFVLDFGPWVGGLAFTALLSAVLLLPNFCRFNSSRYAILISLAYMAFIFPITSRLELPAYIFPLLFIIMVDRFDWNVLVGKSLRPRAQTKRNVEAHPKEST
jgi:oligosaccharide repeat unit polymerase